MYNSDGYVLVDMSEANISSSTQHINGIFDRIINIIDTNKLVLVINAGDLTPLPGYAVKISNYYKIITQAYIFTINSNDIVIIEETGEVTVDVSIVPTLLDGVKIADYQIGDVIGSLYAPEQQSEINDNNTSTLTTWSSKKISDQLDLKANISSLATVATTGDYNDLINTPDVAEIDDTVISESKTWSSQKIDNTIDILLPINTVSGSVANFETSIVKPLVDLTADIVAVQSGSGDPSPSNVRAITGASVCNIGAGTSIYNRSTNTTGKYLNSDGSIGSSPAWAYTDYMEVSGCIYYTGLTTTGTSPYSCWYDSSKNFINSFKQQIGDNKLAVPSGAKYVRFSVRVQATSTDPEDDVTFRLYPTTVAIPLGSTVYGGTLDVTTGLLTIDKIYADMGDLTWTKYTSYTYPFFSANLSTLGIKTAASGDINIMCEIYKPIGALTLGGSGGFGNNAHNLEISQQSSGTQLMIQDSDYSTADAFTEAVRGKKIAFFLATPTTVQLTPTEIDAFLGQNNIFCDTGDTTVRYKCTPQEYIDSKLT